MCLFAFLESNPKTFYSIIKTMFRSLSINPAKFVSADTKDILLAMEMLTVEKIFAGEMRSEDNFVVPEGMRMIALKGSNLSNFFTQALVVDAVMEMNHVRSMLKLEEATGALNQQVWLPCEPSKRLKIK